MLFRSVAVGVTASQLAAKLAEATNASGKTLLDNGMPMVLVRAADFGITGNEAPEAMEANDALRKKVEAIRLKIGPLMNLGDVTKKTVPKMCLVSAPVSGGAVNTRNFIPHRVHKAIGVFGAVSVATACVTPGSVCDGIAKVGKASGSIQLDVEHPTGFFTVEMEVEGQGAAVTVKRSALLRTARKLMSGEIYVPAFIWLAKAARAA